MIFRSSLSLPFGGRREGAKLSLINKKKQKLMPKKLYREIPENYPVCQHADCPRAATCLHRIAYTPQLKKAEYLRTINPNRCAPDGQCPYYRDSAPVTYARGFTNFQSRMYPAQYKTFMNTLVQIFGRNSYFERRRGDTALSPKEQNVVLQALRKAGVTEAPPFDHYEENINWYD